MRFILVIFLILISSGYVLGLEKKAEGGGDEPELNFLKGVSKYQGNNGRTKFLRPLKEFKVGKKYCLWGTDKWDEACQDAAMKYAFGSEWREFKRVIIEFLEAHKRNDPVALAKLFRYPLNASRSTWKHNDGSAGYALEIVDNADHALRYFERAIMMPLTFGLASELYEIKYESLDIENRQKLYNLYELYIRNYFNNGRESEYDKITQSKLSYLYQIPHDKLPCELFLRNSLIEASYNTILINGYYYDSYYYNDFYNVYHYGGYYVITLKGGVVIMFEATKCKNGNEINCQYAPLIESITY